MKIAYKTYKRLSKADNLSFDNFKRALKDSGVDEVVDFAGDLYTIVDPSSSWGDVGKATFDLFTGFETNSKGNKAAANAIKGVTKKLNKNADEAKGNFVLYEVKDGNTVLKVGKANADDVMSTTGNIRRVHTSERKAKKAGYPNAKATITDNLGQTSTGQATVLEAAKVRQKRANGNTLPLNKERDQIYRPPNQ